MPPKSIYLKDETIERINEQMDDSESFSEWVQMAIERELEAEHDELETLTEDVQRLTDEVQELQRWRTAVMDDVVNWFEGEFSPAQ